MDASYMMMHGISSTPSVQFLLCLLVLFVPFRLDMVLFSFKVANTCQNTQHPHGLEWKVSSECIDQTCAPLRTWLSGVGTGLGLVGVAVLGLLAALESKRARVHLVWEVGLGFKPLNMCIINCD